MVGSPDPKNGEHTIRGVACLHIEIWWSRIFQMFLLIHKRLMDVKFDQNRCAKNQVEIHVDI